MKTPGAVYKKLKEVKYRYLSIFYREHLKRLPCNCKYNYKYNFINGDGQHREIRLCLFNPDDPLSPKPMERPNINPFLVDICEEQRHCIKCNAFIFKYSKEDVKKIFENELKDIKIKAIKYPDLCALEWVLDRSAISMGPLGWIENLWIKIKNLMEEKK